MVGVDRKVALQALKEWKQSAETVQNALTPGLPTGTFKAMELYREVVRKDNEPDVKTKIPGLLKSYDAVVAQMKQVQYKGFFGIFQHLVDNVRINLASRVYKDLTKR